MSAQVSTQPEGSGGAVESYRAALRRVGAAEPHRLPGYDELVGAEGVHPEDELLADTIDALGPGGMRAKAAEAARYVSSDGITYGATADGAQARNWHIDPLPTIVGADEWTALERGLEQRARLLDLILRDVYGSRRLLRRGVLPPEIVLGHPGFVRQSDGIALPTAQQLILAATDVARSADGGWVVFGDRTQAPSGAGYAMATRRIVARTLPAVHRRTSTARLRGFFHTVRAALLDSATTNTEAPRVVVLSPGAGSETAFDQAFLATLLGFPLVEGDDLAMRDGRVWMRTPGADQRVDVILRRVDADFADPLELRSGSQLGVPGLIDAARRGQVSVVNPMGAGVLENPCLLHFLAPVSRELLGEDLLLPQPDSWWCGDDTDRQHVLANLDRLVIKPLSRDATTSTRFGWLLSVAERDELAARVEATPWAWSAQEPLPESTAPVVTGNGIEPRRLVLRTFGVAHDDRYAFLPGALGRVAGEAEQDVVSNTAGALAKDVWVLAGRDSAPDWSERESAAEPAAPALAAGTLAPRMADDLHWFGRYAERVEATARILSVVDDLTEDYAARPGSLGAIAMQSIQHAVTMTTGIAPQQRTDAGLDYDAPDRWATDPEAHLRLLVGEESTPGTLAYAVARLVQCAQRVRDQLSLHTWPVLARLEQTLARAGDPNTSRRDTLEAVLESSLALAGIVQQSMIRDATWAYVDAGVRVERAALTVELVRATLAIERSPVIEGQIVEAVLQVGESVITHRRRTSAGEGPSVPVQSALHLLLVDRANPRSLAFQLDRFSEDLRLVDDPQGVAAGAAIAMDLPELDVESLGASDRSALDRLLVDLRRRVDALANALASQHFRRKGPQGTQLTEWTFAQHQARARRSASRRRRGWPVAEQPEKQPEKEDVYAPRSYLVRHQTTYTYSDDVTSCYERGCLQPRDTVSQTVRSSDIEVSPEPDLVTEHRDFFGNFSHYVEVRTPHRELVVTKTSRVDVAWPRPDLDRLNETTVAQARDLVATQADPVERTTYLLPSPLVDVVPQVRDYAQTYLPDDAPLGDALVALTRGIFADFRYAKGATSVKTTLPELLEQREGVCQDFAHLAAGCLRSVGLPGRYVSGYLETFPPPGKKKLQGSDATHAWTAAMVPGGGWIDLDPTNDHLVDSRYVVTAWGRDFRDVSPLKGVIYTEADSSELKVAVDVLRQDGPG